MKTAAELSTLILDSAVEQLAKTHGCTEDQILAGLRAHDAKLLREMIKLIEVGVTVAAETHKLMQHAESSWKGAEAAL